MTGGAMTSDADCAEGGRGPAREGVEAPHLHTSMAIVTARRAIMIHAEERGGARTPRSRPRMGEDEGEGEERSRGVSVGV